MGRPMPTVIQLYRRRDIAGLIEALDVEDVADVRANDARVALSLIGEPAVPLLLHEIGGPSGSYGRPPITLKCHRARIALAGMGARVVPCLLDAIRSGDARLAEGAAECLEAIEEGGVVLLDADSPTPPVAIAYPDDVRATFECKLGRPLAPRSLWEAGAHRGGA